MYSTNVTIPEFQYNVLKRYLITAIPEALKSQVDARIHTLVRVKRAGCFAMKNTALISLRELRVTLK